MEFYTCIAKYTFFGIRDEKLLATARKSWYHTMVCSGIEVVITGLTRKIRFQRSERPRTFPTAQEILRDRIFTSSYRSCVFFLHSSGARITLEIYGELSERSKVRHSKCRVPKRNLGFESLTLRHMNEARFSNIFIEKRASSCPQSLEKSRFFSYPLLTSEGENSQNVK